MNEKEKIYVEKDTITEQWFAFEATCTGLWQVGANYLLIKKIVDFLKETTNVTRRSPSSHAGPPAACRQNFGLSKKATLVELLENL